MRIAATHSRRSMASGWRRAMVRIALFLDLALQQCRDAGSVDTIDARQVDIGRRLSASIASASIFSAMPPISAMRAPEDFEFAIVGFDDVIMGMFLRVDRMLRVSRTGR